MEKYNNNDNKEELNINKLINFLHKYDYNYKTINIDIADKKDNYVILEINIINNDGNNIIKKRYKKYTRKYNRNKAISKNSLINLKHSKINDNFIRKDKDNDKNMNNIEMEIEKLEISNLDLLENKSQIKNYEINLKYNKKHINIIEKEFLWFQRKITNNYKIEIYSINKKIKDFINLKKVNIINGTSWTPKDVKYLLQLLSNKIDSIFIKHNFMLNVKQ